MLKERMTIMAFKIKVIFHCAVPQKGFIGIFFGVTSGVFQPKEMYEFPERLGSCKNPFCGGGMDVFTLLTNYLQ